jgi:hypothetical protein
MQKFSGKYIKHACITVLALSATVAMVNGQTLKPSLKQAVGTTDKLKAGSDSSIKRLSNTYNQATQELQATMGKTIAPLKKSIDDAGRAFLNNLAIKPSAVQLNIKQSATEMLLVPQEVSKNMLSQTKIDGTLKVAGISNQLFFSQQYNFFNTRGFTDFSFKSDIASKYKQMAETLGNGYASVLTKNMQAELTQLKGLKDKIDQSLTKNIDSVVKHATELRHIIPASSLTELNYENIIANKSNASISKLKAELTRNHGNDSALSNKLQQMEKLLSSIEKNKQAYDYLNPDSTIARYEGFIKNEKDKMLAKPSEMKKFVKANQLQGFNFNFLMWAKKIDLGSFFSPGNLASAIKGPGSGMDIGSITKGAQVTLNNKNNIKLFLGDNVTNKVDALWQPGSMETYTNKYQSTAPQLLQRLNAGLSIEDIKALGGINLNISQQTATPNLSNSFFGLTRKFSNFSISKKILNSKLHQLTVDVLTNITSYSKQASSPTKALQVPDLSVEHKSLNYSVNYLGMFKKIEMETSLLLSGSMGDGPSSIGNYDRPLWDMEVSVRKAFLKNRLAIAANLNSSKYNAGLAGNDLSFTNGLMNVRYSIDKKNMVDMAFRANKNGNDALMGNSNTSFELGHIASFKKKGLKYSFYTKIAALHQSTSFKSIRSEGWIKQISSVASVRFPQNFSIQNSVDLSANSFANNTFLTGNRFTIAPGVEFQRKKYSFSTAVVYEQVTGYYQQVGTRNSFVMAGFLNKNLALSTSLDIRYNMKQYVPVFGNKLVSYGSMSIQYSIK